MLLSLAVKLTGLKLPLKLPPVKACSLLAVALLMVTPVNSGSSMVVPILFHLMMNGVPAGITPICSPEGDTSVKFSVSVEPLTPLLAALSTIAFTPSPLSGALVVLTAKGSNSLRNFPSRDPRRGYLYDYAIYMMNRRTQLRLL